MQDLLASGRLIDLILVGVAFEAAALYLLHRWWGLGPGLGRLLANLLAGACLMLAVRLALVDAEWTLIAAALLGALVAHVADLTAQWPRGFAGSGADIGHRKL